VDKIPSELINLIKLDCSGCHDITEIPSILTKLVELQCDSTCIMVIPDTLII